MTTDLDRRWIFLAMGVVVVTLYAFGDAVTIKVNPYSRSYYDTIEALEPGSIVLLSADFDPASAAELAPPYEATIHHLFQRGVRIVSISTWPAAPPYSEQAFQRISANYGKTYGTDWVELGFKPGDDVAMGVIGQSLRDAYPADKNGKPFAEIPLLDDVGDSMEGIDLLITLSAGYPGILEWIAQVGGRYNMPILTGTTAVQTPDLYAFFPNQLKGFLGAATGATMYLQLVAGDEDMLIASMEENQERMLVQSVAHGLIIALIVLGNVLYFRSRGRAA